MENPDRLAELFRLQKDLNDRVGVHTDGMTQKDQQEWLLHYCRAMSQEIAELTDCVPWKWWAKYQTFDHQNARVEVVDMLHFLISAALVLGMNANDLFEAYTKKHRLNLDRQQSGYTVKDESDNKHI
jgi:dimeric dUTPase (all-alpha-NTP-PPase superfamily)